LLIVAKKEAR